MPPIKIYKPIAPSGYKSMGDIILCGNSVGSIVIQHLAIELINNNININNFFMHLFLLITK